MPRKTNRERPPRTTADVARVTRDAQRKELARAVKREREIQKLAARFEREVLRTNDKLQKLTIVLGSFARSIAAERESAASSRT